MAGEIQVGPSTPLLIVSSLERALAHYEHLLGFQPTYKAPDDEPFFALVARGSAQIMLKEIGEGVEPTPNPSLHEWARMDVFIYTSDPDALADEFSERGVEFREPLAENDDNIRGFAVADPDGYVCFFGKPKG